MSRWYILDENKRAVPKDLVEAAAWLDKGNRRVAITAVGEYQVSTVFLGMDHGHNPKLPLLLFETMVFKGDYSDLVCERCSTWKQALEQHEKIVARVKAGKI